MGSKSSSVTKVSQTTQQFDQRVLAESSSIAIGASGRYTYIEEFGEEVAGAFDRLIEFAEEAGRATIEQAERAQEVMSQQFSTQHETLSEQLATAQAPSETFIRKVLPYSVIAFFGILVYLVMRKK